MLAKIMPLPFFANRAVGTLVPGIRPSSFDPDAVASDPAPTITETTAMMEIPAAMFFIQPISALRPVGVNRRHSYLNDFLIE